MMEKCPKCGISNVEGAVICDCGYVLQTPFGAESDHVGEPDIVSSSESYDRKRKRPVSVRPVQWYERKTPRSKWAYWLGFTVIMIALRSLMIHQSYQPPIEPSDRPSFSLADKSPAAGFSLSPTNARTEAPSSQNERAPVVEGGLYCIPAEHGGYQVLKILKVDQLGVHVRLYSNHYVQAPVQIDERTLFMAGMDRKPDEALGAGHLPISKESFATWSVRFVQQSTVTKDELDGYRVWLENKGGYFK